MHLQFFKKLDPLIGQKIDTTKFDPQVAAQTQLQKDASAAAAGLGSLVGPQSVSTFYVTLSTRGD